MSLGINPRQHQSSGAEVTWECPRGHSEADDTPLQRHAYCTACDRLYEWSEVVQIGPVKQRERVNMSAGMSAK